MSVNTLLVKSYANNVFFTGANSFTRIAATRPEYVEPVKIFAAQTYFIDDIDYALTKGWVTPEEHAETLALKGPEDPQRRPPIQFLSTEPTA